MKTLIQPVHAPLNGAGAVKRRNTPKWESKLQIGFEMKVGEKGLLFVGNLIDLDDLLKVATEPVSPNAGTNMQMQVVF